MEKGGKFVNFSFNSKSINFIQKTMHGSHRLQLSRKPF